MYLWWSREGGLLDCALIDAAGGNTSGGLQGKTGGGPLVIPGDGPELCRSIYGYVIIDIV